MSGRPLQRPWRNRLRLSVRGLLILVLVIGGWLGWIVRNARVQRDAVAAIEEAGGHVWYDWESKDGFQIPSEGPWAPKWVVDHVGLEFFGTVVGVALVDGGTDELLVHVGHLRRTERLYLDGSKSVTDFGLAQLRELTNLDWLSVDNTQITDIGLARIKVLRSLKSLALNETKVTDAGLVCLKELPSLKRLYLMDTRVSDAGLAHIADLRGLRFLRLENTCVSKGGLIRLRQSLPQARIRPSGK
jgi:internalin A